MPDLNHLIRLAEVETIVGLRRTQIYAMMKARRFPSPVEIGGASRWSLRAVSAWVNERIKEAEAV